MIPFFSIILPTFNQADFLKLSIKSIINQTYENWELLIINNNSKDKTTEVIKSFKDKRIRAFKINNKGLLAKSRNLGINKARSEWICFIDSDDKWFPEKLMKVKQYIDYKKGDLYYHDLVFENKGFFFKKKISDKSKTIKKPIIKYFAENGNPIGQSSVVVKKNILKRVNLISENKEKFSWEDFDTWIKISKISDRFIRIPNVLGSIWVGPENISNLDRQILNTYRIKKYHYKTFNKFLTFKEKNKSLWWLEYPSILKDFKNKNRVSFFERIDKISEAPLKFYFIFIYMRTKLNLIDLIRKIKKIFTILILFKNKKNLINNNFKKNRYKKINTVKKLSNLKFENFTFPNIFFERIKNNYELHFIYKDKNLISYGWSSKNREFLISEINCEIRNNKNVIFFDFYTIKNFRKMGFYQKLLKMMLINFNGHECYIYTTFFNFKSLKAINKSNFKFVNFFSVFKKRIDLI